MIGHFKVGKNVILERKLYMILKYHAGRVVLIPLEEDGPIRIIRPHYLINMETKQ